MDPATTLDLRGRGELSAERRELLDGIAESVRGPFTAMIDGLFPERAGDMDWWVSETSCRNTYAGPLFSDCCRALLARTVLDCAPEGGTVWTDSPALRRVVRLYGQKLGRTVRARCGKPWAARLLASFRLVLVQAWGHLLLLYRYVAGRWVVPSPRTSLPDQATLADLFLFDNSFRDGPFRDRYYGDFGGHLGPEERRSILYWPTLSTGLRGTVPVLKALRAAGGFLLKEDFLKAGDYVHAFLRPLRSLGLFPRAAILEGLDVTPLVRAAWRRHLFSPASTEGLLNFRFVRRLKEKGAALRLVIDWFENQVIDKGANAGFRRYFPETPVVGHQGFVVPRQYLCMYPTAREAEAGVLPGTLSVCGRGFVEERKEFYPGLKVEVGPAFRFSGLWAERRRRPEPRGILPS